MPGNIRAKLGMGTGIGMAGLPNSDTFKLETSFLSSVKP